MRRIVFLNIISQEKMITHSIAIVSLKIMPETVSLPMVYFYKCNNIYQLIIKFKTLYYKRKKKEIMIEKNHILKYIKYFNS